MSMPKSILFNNALDIAINQIKKVHTIFGEEIILVRDLRGRIRVILPGNYEVFSKEQQTTLNKFSRELTECLGAYGFPPDHAILYGNDLMQGENILISSDRHLVAQEGNLKIWLLDRQIIGQDWIRAQLIRATQNPRVTFFGIKGGIGRSTALVIWAWRLAKQGKKILIIDLDLESPGVSSTLLPSEYLPDYGIVDWFVEDGVGQADLVENVMVSTSPLARDLPGDIRVVPAFGRDTGDYLTKLARCYAGSGGTKDRSWAERLQQMVQLMENKEHPDLVILDSRAGLHDIAAVTVTRMDADTFLFAVDSMQTWNAYTFLFKHWQQHPQIAEFRQKLQVIASMIPETGRDAYLRRFRENSWDLFREHLYDEAEPETADLFSFDLDSMEAPHYPLPIYWNRALQEFDPLRDDAGIDEQLSEAAMGQFMIEAERMVFTQEANQ